jgi:hypothetical protein
MPGDPQQTTDRLAAAETICDLMLRLHRAGVAGVRDLPGLTAALDGWLAFNPYQPQEPPHAE